MSKDEIRLFLKDCFAYWLKWLGLLWWDVKIIYIEDVKKHKKATMWVDADWRYMQAAITVNLDALDGRDEREIERIAVHELCHVLINEMRAGGIDHEERVATILTKAFMWTYEDREKLYTQSRL